MKNKNFEPKYIWDEEAGTATVKMYSPNTKKWVCGKAHCADEDKDMQSEKTGMSIASQRALIALYKDEIKYLKIKRDLYKDLYDTFNLHGEVEKNPQVKIVLRRWYSALNDIEYFENAIKGCQTALDEYIKSKEKFYQSVRSNNSIKNSTDALNETYQRFNDVKKMGKED